MNIKQVSYLIIAVSFFLSSCNLPNSSTEAPLNMATAAALTVEAALTNSQVSIPTPTAVEQNLENEFTATLEANPLASFEDVTNCRVGPGTNYERLTQIRPGFAVEIVGYFPPSYWVVKTESGLCWVAGEFVTPSGSLGAVPTVTAPPTPHSGNLENVSLQKWNISCNYATNEAEVSIIWSDQDGEAGYRVVRNDVVVAELSANTVSFQETITLISGQTAGYSIIVFNSSGQSQSKTIVLSC